MHIKLTRIFLFFCLACGMTTQAKFSHAACSPGIPCVGYEIDDTPDPATDTSLNGLKTEEPYQTSLTAAQNPNTGTTCDANFMNQIYAKAFMEAQREVIMSQQLIHKPDSVLEYTCFDKIIGLTAEHTGMFSGSQVWDSFEVELSIGSDVATSPAPDMETTINDTDDTSLGFDEQQDYSVFTEDRLGLILEPLFTTALTEYINTNFSHTYMGGALSLDNDMDLTAIPTTAAYSCSHMATVWDVARCFDFADEDRFRSFEHFVNNDPRSIPVACSASHISDDAVGATTGGDLIDSRAAESVSDILNITTLNEKDNDSGGMTERCPVAGSAVSGVNTSFSNDLIRLANNCDTTDLTHAYASFDQADMYYEIIKGLGVYLPGVGTTDIAGVSDVIIASCSKPIPTGVPVLTYQYEFQDNASLDLKEAIRTTYLHYDHICPNAGCYYIPIKTPYDYDNIPLPTFDSLTNIGFCWPTGAPYP